MKSPLPSLVVLVQSDALIHQELLTQVLALAQLVLIVATCVMDKDSSPKLKINNYE
jgi:hypothetical protein